MTQKQQGCAECQFEQGEHSQGCSKFKEIEWDFSQGEDLREEFYKFAFPNSDPLTGPTINEIINWWLSRTIPKGEAVRLKEEIKGINGDPFADKEDVLDGYMLCKAKVLEILKDILKL